ncbi:hypothetical protein M405DRAFT_818975 [Rhizopogon salebrosus TDB-379]|nr:hypothetical protein M405DRAFT_818975 [Rhizopogon salebrosus TDB-379]
MDEGQSAISLQSSSEIWVTKAMYLVTFLLLRLILIRDMAGITIVNSQVSEALDKLVSLT